MKAPVDSQILASLARLFEYPGEHTSSLVASVHREISECAPDALEPFVRFSKVFLGIPQESREELATATFEITPAVAPYVSIHLFGEENFKRGEFMAALSAQYAQRGFNTGGELPDHLAVILRFASGLDADEQRDLLRYCILGPIRKMIHALDRANPYRSLIEAVQEVLRTAHPDLEPARSPLEQMREHHDGCTPLGSGCNCGSAQADRLPLAPQQTD